jgi:hypothetical protein
MAGCARRSRKLLGLLVLAALLGGGALVWVERTPLLAWLYLRQLTRASAADRPPWAERVAGLGEAALPGIVDYLQQDNDDACAAAHAALEQMTRPWGPSDPRTVDLAYLLARDFSHLSCQGQSHVLQLAAGWFEAEPGRNVASGLLSACTRMLADAGAHADADAEEYALVLCGHLLAQPDSAEVLSPAQELVRAALASPQKGARLHAVRLALDPHMDLFDQVVSLLHDPEAEVRRAAVLAVGPIRDAVHDESLLPCLHDEDAEVRRLCRAALEGRGLKPEYIEMGRLLTDPCSAARLQVLDHLFGAADLDASIWLRRLSHDSSPAVRVAAMRVMATQELFDLSDRLEQMAQADPSPTVCQLARFYLEEAPRRHSHLLHAGPRGTPGERSGGVVPALFTTTSPAP